MTLTPTRTDLGALARRYAATADDWPFAPRFDPLRRWYARLAVTDDHEAWLLTWLPGQATDLHDHGGSAGAFTVVSGALTEHFTASAGPPLTGTVLAAGATRAFGPWHVHRIVNAARRPAVSVHVYAPAITTMTRYDFDEDGLHVVGIDRAGQDW